MIQPTLEQVLQERAFLQNWLTDLLAAIDITLDQPTRVRLFEACGRGCFQRFPFKQEIARRGKGSLENLVAAYRENFECWQAEDGVHIRYGETSATCYCPVARLRPAQPDDLHCECTRATHQMIFQTALIYPAEVEIVETLRRGGRTCHFVARIERT